MGVILKKKYFFMKSYCFEKNLIFICVVNDNNFYVIDNFMLLFIRKLFVF